MRIASVALVTGLNLFLRRHLPAELYERLDGREVEIAIKGTTLRAAFLVRGRHFKPTRPSGEPHLRFRARAKDFILIAARAADADTLYFQRRLAVEGDTESALLVKNTLDALEFPRSRAFLRKAATFLP